MAGRKSFKALSGNFTAEQREQVDAAKARLRKEMTLAELRQARQLPSEHSPERNAFKGALNHSDLTVPV